MKIITVIVSLFAISTSLIFFYPIFNGKIPFPGDLLVGEYNPYSSNPIPNKAQGPDVVRQLFPWKYFVIQSFKNFEIPFWNPYSLSGNPLMANFQSGSFYPINLLFFIFDFADAWTIFIILTPILASLFLYFFLREIDLKVIPSIFAGVVFAYSSYIVVWIEYGNVGHTFLWLPIMLFFIEKFLKRQELIYLFYFILSSSVSFLAGYIQGYFYVVCVCIFYFVGRGVQLKKLDGRSIYLFIASLILPILLTAFQLLPTIELFKFSSRGNYNLHQIDKLLNPIWYLITVIVPNFFGHPASRNTWFYGTYIERVSYFGFIPFILSIYALLNFRIRKEIIIFGSLFALSVFLSTNLFFNKYIYLIPFPFLSTTVPTRILSIFIFSGSILAGFGLQLVIEKINKKNLAGSIIMLWLIILLLWIFILLVSTFHFNISWFSNLAISKRNLVIPTLLLVFFSILLSVYIRFKNFKGIFLVSVFVLTSLDLFYFFHKITPFAPKEYIYPNTAVFDFLKKESNIDRFWGYGSGYIENNFSIIESLYSPNGYEPMHIKRYGELVSTSKKGRISSLLSRSDVNIHPGFGDSDLNQNKYRQRILDLLGVKYVLNKNDSLGLSFNPDYNTFSEDKYNLVWQKAPWQIYENKKALPRVFLASDYVVHKYKNRIIELIFDNKFDIRNTVILEEEIEPKIFFSKDKDARVKVEKYSPNKVILQTNSKTNMILFISDNYYPGWEVRVDGKNDKIYRANYSFKAVPVRKGKHEIIFSYFPNSFNSGVKISLTTLVFLTLIIIAVKLLKINVQK